MFGKIGIGELILILAIALVIFGPAKLPEIGKVIGDTIRNFRKHSEKPAGAPEDPASEPAKEAPQARQAKALAEAAKPVGISPVADGEATKRPKENENS